MDIHRHDILCLNSAYQRIGWTSAAKAFSSLMSDGEAPAALALDIEYEYINGEPNFDKIDYFYAVDFEDWLELPIRSWDKFIITKDRDIRCPTIILAQNFSRMPQKQPIPTARAIRERDKGICQYSGEKVGPSNSNIDHILPVSRGGRSTWENMVLSKKELNFRKSNKTNEEAGLKLIRKPFAPKPIPLCNTILENKHNDHRFF